MSAHGEVLSYEVNKAFGFNPGVKIDGHFACPENSSRGSLEVAIEDLGKKAERGVLAIIPEEDGYSWSPNFLPSLVKQGVRINGIVTFGATGDVRKLKHGSHLPIICHDLEIPLCIARMPRRLSGEMYSRSSMFIQFEDFQGEAGRIARSKDGQRVKLKI